ncbi:proline-rich receptor-like protein kinase PERK2 [Carcharodon carcharias]|uniref:proline-rich receptor-like protein kinase PERK2 n=1 Tax=Carcharodon carcharias TaxID=13397 RepID=UPI001B7EF336|nr:proline-rich receptor-like protein kinase PERK2 [Carcharodon carcharias]
MHHPAHPPKPWQPASSPAWPDSQPPPLLGPAWLGCQPPPLLGPAWLGCQPPPMLSPAWLGCQPPPMLSPAWPDSQPPPLLGPAWPSCQPPPLHGLAWPNSQPPPLLDPAWPSCQPPPLLGPAWPDSQPPPLLGPAWRDSQPPPLLVQPGPTASLLPCSSSLARQPASSPARLAWPDSQLPPLLGPAPGTIGGPITSEEVLLFLCKQRSSKLSKSAQSLVVTLNQDSSQRPSFPWMWRNPAAYEFELHTWKSPSSGEVKSPIVESHGLKSHSASHGDQLESESTTRFTVISSVSELFNLIAMLQTQKLLFILLTVTAKVTAEEAMIQEKTYPITHIGNECRIKTKNISSGCSFGWQEEKEWNVDNRPIAILEKGKPLNCIEPCINLWYHEIWLNCTAIKYTLVKYTYRCTKDNQVDEFSLHFKADMQERVSSFPNLTAVTPESQPPKLKVENHMHIGIGISIVIVVLVMLLIYFKGNVRESS